MNALIRKLTGCRLKPANMYPSTYQGISDKELARLNLWRADRQLYRDVVHAHPEYWE